MRGFMPFGITMALTGLAVWYVISRFDQATDLSNFGMVLGIWVSFIFVGTFVAAAVFGIVSKILYGDEANKKYPWFYGRERVYGNTITPSYPPPTASGRYIDQNGMPRCHRHKKVIHATMKDAEDRVSNVARQGNYRRPYRDPACGFYHTSSQQQRTF